MSLYRIEIESRKDLADLVRVTGADERSFYFFERKRRMLAFFIPEVDFRAANALKQELLSRGGDAIVHRGAMRGRPRSSVADPGNPQDPGRPLSS